MGQLSPSHWALNTPRLYTGRECYSYPSEKVTVDLIFGSGALFLGEPGPNKREFGALSPKKSTVDPNMSSFPTSETNLDTNIGHELLSCHDYSHISCVWELEMRCSCFKARARKEGGWRERD